MDLGVDSKNVHVRMFFLPSSPSSLHAALSDFLTPAPPTSGKRLFSLCCYCFLAVYPFPLICKHPHIFSSPLSPDCSLSYFFLSFFTALLRVIPLCCFCLLVSCLLLPPLLPWSSCPLTDPRRPAHTPYHRIPAFCPFEKPLSSVHGVLPPPAPSLKVCPWPPLPLQASTAISSTPQISEDDCHFCISHPIVTPMLQPHISSP